MNKILRCVITVLLLAYVVVAVSWSRTQADAARCSGVDIRVTDTVGTRFVTAREIAREIGDLPDRAPGLTNTDGRVLIEVDPLHPVARIFEHDRSYYINKDGKRISANARYHTDVPVISGRFDSLFHPRDILPLVRYIDNDSTWCSLITHIKVEDRRNIILIPLIHGHVINIGDMDDLDNKFYRLKRAYKEILPVKGWDFYDTLTVKWGGQLVATRRVKRLHHAISAVDLDAEKELPDIGTMLVGDSAGVAVEHKKTAGNKKSN